MEHLTKLTEEDVKNMIIHPNVSSLRRASSVSEVEKVDASDEVPTLYYITKDEVTSVHALATDLVSYLILKSVKE